MTFGHHLLAYVEMAARDRGRFADARARLNESPLGAAALAGTSFPIDRGMTAKALGFARPMANSLDAVADRDFVLETLSACAIAIVHLSRFAEEIVIWSSPLVGFLRLSDRFTTGSSIMPQKRNPDAAELIRAKTGRVVGALTALLVVMKGLPLAYQKDMQEDKEGTIDAFGTLSQSIALMTKMVNDMEPDVAAMANAAGAGYSTATDLADWLVRTLQLPFRDAHHVTGRIVAAAAAAGVRARQVAAQGDAGGRAAHHQGGLRRALGRQFGEEPQGLRRHGAAKRAGAGQTLAQTLEKAAVNGLVKALATGCRHNVAAAIWFAMLTFERASGERPLARYRLKRWCCACRCRCGRAVARRLRAQGRAGNAAGSGHPAAGRRRTGVAVIVHAKLRRAGNAAAARRRRGEKRLRFPRQSGGRPEREKIVHPRSDPAIVLRARLKPAFRAVANIATTR